MHQVRYLQALVLFSTVFELQVPMLEETVLCGLAAENVKTILGTWLQNAVLHVGVRVKVQHALSLAGAN